MRLFAVAALLGLVLAHPLRAGIYTPNEPFLFELDEKSFANPIQFSGGFDLIRAELREIAIPPKNPGDPPNLRRQEVLDRVKRLQGLPKLEDHDLAILTGDLIRLSDDRAATNILQPRAARGGFMVYMHMARARAGQGDWQDAVERERIALADFPTAYKPYTKPQFGWLKRVEREYYLPFLSRRAEESRGGRLSRRVEELDELFPTVPAARKPDNSLRFVGPEGTYMAGGIADSERAKLPPDALAIIQQLVLWHPFDGRLYWLLGELYNAEGDVETAYAILDECTNAMAVTNETIKEHRRILKSAAEAMATARNEQQARARQQAEEEKAQQARDERDYWKRFWWILAIGVGLVLILIYYQYREVGRRLRRGRGR